ncbi:MAG: hypothetical protein WCF96_01475 [Eubacteriales bacterium]
MAGSFLVLSIENHLEAAAECRFYFAARRAGAGKFQAVKKMKVDLGGTVS